MQGQDSTTLLGVFGAAFLGTDSTTLVGVFEAEPDFVGSTGDTVVGRFSLFGGSTGGDLHGTFGPEAEAGEGGVGHSWYVVELTSEHAYVPGEGGVGHSWYVVELTSDHVEPAPVGQPGPVHPLPKKRRRRERVTYRAPGRFTVVESIETRGRGYFTIDRERRFAGIYAVVASTTAAFNANYVVSDLHALLLQEEDELLLLLLEDS